MTDEQIECFHDIRVGIFRALATDLGPGLRFRMLALLQEINQQCSQPLGDRRAA